MVFDWGTSTLRVLEGTFVGAPSVSGVLVALAIIAGASLMLWSLTERIPPSLHIYTVIVVVMALVTSANWIGSKPRFILPAILLALPVGRLLAPLRTSVLVPLIAVLTALSTWFGLYLVAIGRWAPSPARVSGTPEVRHRPEAPDAPPQESRLAPGSLPQPSSVSRLRFQTRIV